MGRESARSRASRKNPYMFMLRDSRSHAKSIPVSSLKKRGNKDEDEGFFLTQKEAEKALAPMMEKVRELVRNLPEQPVADWDRRLSQWQTKMARGNYRPNRTPLFDRYSYPELAAYTLGFVRRGRGVMRKATGPYFTKLIEEIEEHQSEKISGRGNFPPIQSGWVEAFMDKVYTDKPMSKDVDRAALQRCYDWLADSYKGEKLDINEASLEKMWRSSFKAQDGAPSESALNTDTNSCFPDYVRHWLKDPKDPTATPAQREVSIKIRGEVTKIFKVAMRARNYKEILPYLHFIYTCNQRTNVGSGYKLTEDNTWHGVYHSKLRGVGAAPKTDTCLGKVCYTAMLPALRSIKNENGVPMYLGLFHPAQIDKSCQMILETAKDAKLIPLSIDYSAFDSTLPPWMMWGAAQAVSKWMTDRMANLWLALVYAFIYQSSMISLTKFYPEQPSSMKSGSWLTNMMDSFCNLIGQRYSLEAGYFKSVLVHVAHGDDGIVLGEGVNPDTYQTPAGILGFSANAEKQYYRSGALSFCQKTHFIGLPGGVYPLDRCMAALVSIEDDVARIETDPEITGQYPYVLAFRTVCRMETSAFHPLFAQFVNMVANEDKIHLGREMSPNELAKLAGSYAHNYIMAVADKPWKQLAMEEKGGFGHLCVNRVLHGEVPPPLGRARFEWVYGVNYEKLHLHGPNPETGEWAFAKAA